MASLADPPGAGLLNQKYVRCMKSTVTDSPVMHLCSSLQSVRQVVMRSPEVHLGVERCVQSRRIARGNPVRIRDCPAAVSRNDRRHQHWAACLGSDGQ